MKLWIDDIRKAPSGYYWCKDVNSAKKIIKDTERYNETHSMINVSHQIEVIDIDHDSGEFAKHGGDYIRLLDWLEETGRSYPIHIHSMNPVGVENMRAIIRRNNWTEV